MNRGKIIMISITFSVIALILGCWKNIDFPTPKKEDFLGEENQKIELQKPIRLEEDIREEKLDFNSINTQIEYQNMSLNEKEIENKEKRNAIMEKIENGISSRPNMSNRTQASIDNQNKIEEAHREYEKRKNHK